MNEVTTNITKPKCLLFLSWQSDRKKCRNFMFSVVDKLSKEVSNLVTVMIDRDTVNVPGAPDIGDTIFEKIDRCDLFIADITLINDKGSGFRRTPNPNVMLELGYAIKTLGWERILLIQCDDYGDVEELPFDINHRRICNYSLGSNDEDSELCTKKRKDSKKQVVENAATTIRLLLDKNLLFGGKKGRVPKFEISWKANKKIMMELEYQIKNVSSIMVSGLQSHGLLIRFSNGKTRAIECRPQFSKTSISMGEETVIRLNNPILGAGPGFNNYAWSNIDLEWQFSCEDEEGSVYYYEMKRHIDDAERPNCEGIWAVKFIG